MYISPVGTERLWVGKTLDVNKEYFLFVEKKLDKHEIKNKCFYLRFKD